MEGKGFSVTCNGEEVALQRVENMDAVEFSVRAGNTYELNYVK